MKISVSFTDQVDKKKASVAITKIDYSVDPDPEREYKIKYRQRLNSSDIIDIEAPGQLLKKVSTTDDDQTVEIIKKGVEIIKEVSNIAAALETESASLNVTEKKRSECGDFNFDLIYRIPYVSRVGFDEQEGKNWYFGDPDNCFVKYDVKIRRIDDEINKNGKRYSQARSDRKYNVSQTNLSRNNNRDELFVANSMYSANRGICNRGICFRLPAEYQITITLRATKTVMPSGTFSSQYQGFAKYFNNTFTSKSSRPTTSDVRQGEQQPTDNKEIECDSTRAEKYRFYKNTRLKLTGSISEDVNLTLCAKSDVLVGRISGDKWQSTIQGELRQTSIGVWDSELVFLNGQKNPDIASIKGTLSITQNGKMLVKISGTKDTEGVLKEIANVATTAHVWAPSNDPLGVLFFWRKQFVKNSTTATFDSGMLTGLKVENPSQIAGFLSIPLEILKAVPILIAIN